MTTTVRPATSVADLQAWRRAERAARPDERIPPAEELLGRAGPRCRYFLADLDGELAGSGLVCKSELGGNAAALLLWVIPAAQRKGVGTAIFRVLAGNAVEMGFGVAGFSADTPGAVRFAGRFGFGEVDRQVEQVRAIGDEPPPPVPAGVTIVPVSARPELWPVAYEQVGSQAFQDVATFTPMEITLERWEKEYISDQDATFLALAGEDVVGCAGLLPDPDQPERAEYGLTAVRRDWRGRGVAYALKRTTLTWAASAGITEVYTWTQRGNEAMLALNTRLGFTIRSESVYMRANLPLAT